MIKPLIKYIQQPKYGRNKIPDLREGYLEIKCSFREGKCATVFQERISWIYKASPSSPTDTE